jgi:hypothetical protein
MPPRNKLFSPTVILMSDIPTPQPTDLDLQHPATRSRMYLLLNQFKADLTIDQFEQMLRLEETTEAEFQDTEYMGDRLNILEEMFGHE